MLIFAYSFVLKEHIPFPPHLYPHSNEVRSYVQEDTELVYLPWQQFGKQKEELVLTTASPNKLLHFGLVDICYQWVTEHTQLLMFHG